jgi:sodium-independent sulfate anion transporter 11
MGPTAIISLMTYQTVNGKGPEHAILLCFFTGLVLLAMGLLGLGKPSYFGIWDHLDEP